MNLDIVAPRSNEPRLRRSVGGTASFIALLIGFFGMAPESFLEASGENRNAQATGKMISAIIPYETQMLIVASKDGVAAIKFQVEVKVKDGVAYDFRFLTKSSPKVSSGNGRVFWKGKPIPVGDPRYKLGAFIDDGSVNVIHAGAIHLNWSHRSIGEGWIYYDPDLVRVMVANPEDFDRIDLNRFQLK